MGNIDIIIYALVAAILLVRLWAVLGRRNDEDRQRPNPFAAPAPGARADADVPFQLDRSRGDDPSSLPLGQPTLAAPMSLMGALEKVRQLDPSFDEKQFLQNARETFASVVAGFAKGDLSDVIRLLGPTVLAGFQSAMAARKAAGETLETRISRIRDAETTAARIEDNRVFVTVRFTSEQENILRDASGNIVHGAPGRTEEITDLWTLAHDTKTPGSEWQLVETRS
jgi:predicted lipid-binding transport protein (Tim44 family)